MIIPVGVIKQRLYWKPHQKLIHSVFTLTLKKKSKFKKMIPYTYFPTRLMEKISAWHKGKLIWNIWMLILDFTHTMPFFVSHYLNVINGKIVNQNINFDVKNILVIFICLIYHHWIANLSVHVHLCVHVISFVE